MTDRRWCVYREVRLRLSAAGMSSDQAAEAARLADLALRDRRDDCIRRARRAGLGVREIARIWGIDHAAVLRITRAGGD